MNTEELYKAGHPSTWEAGDIFSFPNYKCDQRYHWRVLSRAGDNCEISRLDGHEDRHFNKIANLSTYTLIRRANQQENTATIEWTKSADVAPLPVIEQKPYCHLCTVFIHPDGEKTQDSEIHHEDPCQFTSAERYMLPIAKAQFRERQEALRTQRQIAELFAKDAKELADEEVALSVSVNLVCEEKYSRLTGHKFE